MDTPSQITVYLADSNGAFTHATTANEFPLAKGTYNIPVNAHVTEPPLAAPGYVQVAIAAETWVVMEDNRGKTLYNIENATAYSFGTTIMRSGTTPARYTGLGLIPDWLTPLEPPKGKATWENDAWVALPEPPQTDESEESQNLTAS